MEAVSSKSIYWRAIGLFNYLKSILLKVRFLLFVFSYQLVVGFVYNKSLIPLKRKIFADIDSVVPSNNKEPLRILEVGVGPGYNLEFYPKKCRLIALDRNPYFKDTLLTKLEKYPGIILEKFVNNCAENMTSIPSNSVDVVVTTNVQCSLEDNQSALAEIRRVLVPGGRYYFLEHGLDEPGTLRRKVQQLVNKMRFWKWIWHGCIFDDFEPKISKFGLFNYKGKRYTVDDEPWYYYVVAYLTVSHYGGCAVNVK